jgi:hypothetical protein
VALVITEHLAVSGHRGLMHSRLTCLPVASVRKAADFKRQSLTLFFYFVLSFLMTM